MSVGLEVGVVAGEMSLAIRIGCKARTGSKPCESVTVSRVSAAFSREECDT